MNTFKIIDPGFLSTVQDLGRYGFQKYGVSPSGVMDTFATEIANKLVGNEKSKAVIETTMKGLEIEVLETSLIAITGGNCEVLINNEKKELWKSHKISKGDIVKMGFCKEGVRNYVAFKGGIDVPFIMGSSSTNLRAKFGGFKGRKLEKNDEIETGYINKNDSLKEMELFSHLIPKYEKKVTLDVILGQQKESFTKEGIKTFLKSEYKVSQENDRMGIRLDGNEIEHISSADIISDGITFGAIQIPGNGQPIIMMADRQTTGGYTKIGNVTSLDLSKLAQVTPGSAINFNEISLTAARNKLIEKEEFYKEEKNFLKEKQKNKIYNIKVNNLKFKVELLEIKEII